METKWSRAFHGQETMKEQDNFVGRNETASQSWYTRDLAQVHSDSELIKPDAVVGRDWKHRTHRHKKP